MLFGTTKFLFLASSLSSLILITTLKEGGVEKKEERTNKDIEDKWTWKVEQLDPDKEGHMRLV